MEQKYLFIGTGEKFGFYTLRVMTLDFDASGNRVLRDYYIKNLSTDSSTAVSEARKFAEHYGVPFRGDAGFDLEEIRRSTHEQAKAKREETERQQAEEKAAYEREVNEGVLAGFILIGKYKGKTAEEISKTDIPYLFWLAGEIEASFPKMRISASIAKKFLKENNIQKPSFIGEVGETITLELTLKSAFWTTGRFPTIAWKCVTDEGNAVTFFSVAAKFKELDENDRFTVKGIVKEHYTDWNGNKSTTLTKTKRI